MKKIKYSKTGDFTETQKKLCKEIAERIAKLRKCGCSVLGKQDCLQVYLTKELAFSNLVNFNKSYSNDYPIPYLHAGYINDSGADDTEFFIDEALDLDNDEL